ncbi:MAG: radical SAM protein [Lachnospiraceae bacterium]|nr:radical SAM protein [Lachnospiraceae bacterium]
MKDKIEVHLHTNDNCNLKCIHCYNKSGENSSYNIPEIGDLLQLIQFFCTEYEAEIHLEGGEIFLRPELLRRMSSLPSETLQCITITTNGTIRIDELEIIDMLCKIHALRISVEGHTDEQQHIVRGIGLDKVVENALFYKEKGIPVWLRLTMTRRNCEHLLDGTLPYYMDKGFRDFQIYEFQAVGRGEMNWSLLTVEDDMFVSFLNRLAAWKGFLMTEDLHMVFMFSDTRREAVLSHKEQLELNRLKVSNIPAENGVSIHADGFVYLCAWDNEESHSILNVYKKGIKYMIAKLEKMDLKHSCSHCSAVRIVY